MGYTNKIPQTLDGAEMLKKHLQNNINIENIAHAFSMTGMSIPEMMDLQDTISQAMFPLRKAYKEITEYSQYFLDQFTTYNNDYYFYAKNCMGRISVSIWAYKKAFLSFIPSNDWRRIKRRIREGRDLYSCSTLSKKMPICKDLFPDLFPDEVWDLTNLVKSFFNLFHNCVNKIESTIAELNRRKRDVKKLTELYTQYREALIANVQTITVSMGITPTFTKSSTNPLFKESLTLHTDEEKAVKWYHNCNPLDLKEYLTYEHYYGNTGYLNVPIEYIVDNLHSFFGNKPKLTVLITELYETFGNGNLRGYYYDFALSYKKRYGKKCVSYEGVDKHRNHNNKKSQYTNQIFSLRESYQKFKANNTTNSTNASFMASPKFQKPIYQ